MYLPLTVSPTYYISNHTLYLPLPTSKSLKSSNEKMQLYKTSHVIFPSEAFLGIWRILAVTIIAYITTTIILFITIIFVWYSDLNGIPQLMSLLQEMAMEIIGV